MNIGIKRPENELKVVAEGANARLESEGNPKKWNIFIKTPAKSLVLTTYTEKIALAAFAHYDNTPNQKYIVP